MATSFIFGGRQRKLPGVYATIKSKITNPAAIIDYGRLLIIDNGVVNAGYGGGAGVIGTLASGADSIYRFDNIESFRDFVKGGYLWKIAEPLFFPDKGVSGVSEIIFAKAATTAAATLTFTATGGGAKGGTFSSKVRDEGLIGNGAKDLVDTALLIKGYGFKFITGVKDPTKWIMQFCVGTFKGDAADGVPYDEVESVNTVPQVLVQSPEFNNIQTLLDWAAIDPGYNQYFSLDSTSATAGDGSVILADITSGYTLASGGTETYADERVTEILDLVKNIDYAFILADNYGSTGYDDAINTLLQTHIEEEARFDKFMVVAGGDDSTEFTAADGSQDIAEYFDSSKVIVVHGGVKKVSQTAPSGMRIWDAFYHAALMVGRMASLAPQIPLTFKKIGVDGLSHILSDSDQEICLDSGILTTIYDSDSADFRILQGINTLQNNTYVLNSDSTSFSIQLNRIISQLNRELIVKAKTELLQNPQGVNRNTLSAAYLKNWIETYLQTKVATGTVDNLILSYQDVTVTLVQDSYFATYSVVANSEITKIFITGFMI